MHLTILSIYVYIFHIYYWLCLSTDSTIDMSTDSTIDMSTDDVTDSSDQVVYYKHLYNISSGVNCKNQFQKIREHHGGSFDNMTQFKEQSDAERSAFFKNINKNILTPVPLNHAPRINLFYECPNCNEIYKLCKSERMEGLPGNNEWCRACIIKRAYGNECGITLRNGKAMNSPNILESVSPDAFHHAYLTRKSNAKYIEIVANDDIKFSGRLQNLTKNEMIIDAFNSAGCPLRIKDRSKTFLDTISSYTSYAAEEHGITLSIMFIAAFDVSYSGSNLVEKYNNTIMDNTEDIKLTIDNVEHKVKTPDISKVPPGSSKVCLIQFTHASNSAYITTTPRSLLDPSAANSVTSRLMNILYENAAVTLDLSEWKIEDDGDFDKQTQFEKYLKYLHDNGIYLNPYELRKQFNEYFKDITSIQNANNKISSTKKEKSSIHTSNYIESDNTRLICQNVLTTLDLNGLPPDTASRTIEVSTAVNQIQELSVHVKHLYNCSDLQARSASSIIVLNKIYDNHAVIGFGTGKGKTRIALIIPDLYEVYNTPIDNGLPLVHIIICKPNLIPEFQREHLKSNMKQFVNLIEINTDTKYNDLCLPDNRRNVLLIKTTVCSRYEQNGLLEYLSEYVNIGSLTFDEASGSCQDKTNETNMFDCINCIAKLSKLRITMSATAEEVRFRKEAKMILQSDISAQSLLKIIPSIRYVTKPDKYPFRCIDNITTSDLSCNDMAYHINYLNNLIKNNIIQITDTTMNVNLSSSITNTDQINNASAIILNLIEFNKHRTSPYKIIIGSTRVSDVHISLERMFPKHVTSCSTLGDIGDLNKARDRFVNDPECLVLLISNHSAKGLNKISDVCAFIWILDKFTYESYMQLYGRIKRISDFFSNTCRICIPTNNLIGTKYKLDRLVLGHTFPEYLVPCEKYQETLLEISEVLASNTDKNISPTDIKEITSVLGELIDNQSRNCREKWFLDAIDHKLRKQGWIVLVERPIKTQYLFIDRIYVSPCRSFMFVVEGKVCNVHDAIGGVGQVQIPFDALGELMSHLHKIGIMDMDIERCYPIYACFGDVSDKNENTLARTDHEMKKIIDARVNKRTITDKPVNGFMMHVEFCNGTAQINSISKHIKYDAENSDVKELFGLLLNMSDRKRKRSDE